MGSKVVDKLLGIRIWEKFQILVMDAWIFPFLKQVSTKLVVLLPLFHLVENIIILFWRLTIFFINKFIASLPDEKQWKNVKKKCMGVWNNDIKKRMIAFSEKVAFEFQLRNQEDTKDQNVQHLVAQIDVKGVDVLPDSDKNGMNGNQNDGDEMVKVSPTINAQIQSRKRENRRKQSKNIAVNSPKPKIKKPSKINDKQTKQQNKEK